MTGVDLDTSQSLQGACYNVKLSCITRGQQATDEAISRIQTLKKFQRPVTTGSLYCYLQG